MPGEGVRWRRGGEGGRRASFLHPPEEESPEPRMGEEADGLFGGNDGCGLRGSVVLDVEGVFLVAVVSHGGTGGEGKGTKEERLYN